MTILFLVGKPARLNVPYFVPSEGRQSSIRTMKKTEVPKVMDRRSAQWLDQHGIDLLETRNYEKELHAAFYATWVKFQNETQRLEFVSLFPRYDVKRRLAKNEAETRELKEMLDLRRHRGDFDLSRVGDGRQREDLARIYLEQAKKIEELEEEYKYLTTAVAYGLEWETATP